MGAPWDQYGPALAEQRDHGVRSTECGTAGGSGAGGVDSGRFARKRTQLSLARSDRHPGLRVSRRTVAGLGRTAQSRVLRGYKPQQFVRISADDYARDSPDRRNLGAILGGEQFPAAQADRGAPNRGRYRGLVLALHGCALDLRVCSVRVCAVDDSGRCLVESKGEVTTKHLPLTHCLKGEL